MVRTKDTNIVVIPLTTTRRYRFVLAVTTSKPTVQSLCAVCLLPGVTPGIGRWGRKKYYLKVRSFYVQLGVWEFCFEFEGAGIRDSASQAFREFLHRNNSLAASCNRARLYLSHPSPKYSMCNCIYCVWYCVCSVISFIYVFSYLFFLYCHRVTTKLQLIIIIIIITEVFPCFFLNCKANARV
jgi:hypothetical protein